MKTDSTKLEIYVDSAFPALTGITINDLDGVLRTGGNHHELGEQVLLQDFRGARW